MCRRRTVSLAAPHLHVLRGPPSGSANRFDGMRSAFSFASPGAYDPHTCISSSEYPHCVARFVPSIRT